MQTDLNNSLTFLCTSIDPPEDDFFQGYFFCGNDYIYGSEGALDFMHNTGKQLGAGHDGCYVHVRRHSRGVEFNTDFSGYKIIYYYHDGESWAVSNSFAQIVDFLRREKGFISPNYSHLGSIFNTNSTNNQLFSFNTLVRNVKVLPRGTTLIMTPDRTHLLRLRAERAGTYEDGLSEHLERWVSRFETLMSDDRVQFSLDLTGGLDSRTNLALAIAAMRRLGNSGHPPRFTCAGSTAGGGDFQVAEELCDHYGLQLNPPNKVKPIRFTPEEGYSAYRDLSLGVYNPLVIPAVASSAFRVHAGGGGGEVHRDFYNPNQVERYFDGHARRNVHTWLGYEAAKDGRDAVAFLRKFDNAHPLRLHYREFRHRFHVGRAPRLSTSFTPLDSVSADAAQLAAGKSRVDAGQLIYDILSSLDPELLDLPFDSPHKAPSNESRSNLSSVQIATDASPGRIWAGEGKVSSSPNTSFSTAQRARVADSALTEAIVNPFVKSFLGEATLEQARQLMQKLTAGGSIGNPVNGYPISAVLSAHLVAPSQ